MTSIADVQALYDAYARNDIPAILKRLAPDIRWRINAPALVPYAGERKGVAAVEEWFAVLARSADVTRFVPEIFVASGSRVIVLGDEEGRAQATGRTWRGRWAQVWTLRGEHVIEFEDIVDSATVAAAFDG